MKHKLYKGDCLEVMKSIKDKSVDMILCDLPYGTTACKWDNIIPLNDYIVFKNKQYDYDEFILYCIKKNIFKTIEEIKIYFNSNKQEGLWSYYNRIIKDNGAIVLFGSEPFSSYLRNSNIKKYKYDWYWIKEKGKGHLNAKKMPLKSIETISVFYKMQTYYNPQKTKGEPYKRLNCSNNSLNKGVYGKTKDTFDTISTGERYPKTDLYFTSVQRTIHPTQKPVELLEYLIKTYSKENELILDNCMGSNSTGIACLNTDRDYIGIEKDDKYFDICINRTNEYIEKNNIKCEIEVYK